MLIELRIRDLAVIEDLSLELGAGLNVLSGETGAGKSIIVGALSLLLGERASTEAVRVGSERATVEAVFDVTVVPEVRSRLDEVGFPPEEGLLILKREVHREGRNRAWVNGSPATAGMVGELGRMLVDLHGQHEHQTLLRPSEQRDILDAYAGAQALAASVRALHARLAALEKEREAREGRRKELEARGDFLRFQLGEIQAARVEPEEDARVQEELRRLEHAEELARDSEALHRLLYDEEGAVSERLAGARELVGRLARFDPRLESLREQVDALYHQVVEVARTAGSYASRVELSPERTEELRDRADLLFRLKRKHGPELADVIAHRDRIEAELAELDGAGIELGELSREIERVSEELGQQASELTRARTEAGDRLAREIETVLPELGMPGARFQIAIESLESPEAGGAERVNFLASLNPGFEARALSRIASGGELSRLMLALKSILAREDRISTIVFDEIDAGIGGAVAVAVGTKLERVAEHHQVFVITHLAQLASRGRCHLRVEKGERDGVALTSVRSLEGEERIREIARMLGGSAESETSRGHARELLSAASAPH